MLRVRSIEHAFDQLDGTLRSGYDGGDLDADFADLWNLEDTTWDAPRIFVAWQQTVELVEPIPAPSSRYARTGWQVVDGSEYRMVRRLKEICPSCGARSGVPIAYGFPGAELQEEAERGDVVLGGCVIGCLDPSHFCRACGSEWLKDDASGSVVIGRPSQYGVARRAGTWQAGE